METMTIEMKHAAVIRFRQGQAGGYIFRYTLYKEKADPMQIRDMNEGLDPESTSLYSVKIETVNEKDATDFEIAYLPQMTDEIDRAKELLDMLYENRVSADTAYEIIEEIL